jgi:beta-glucanase (GH16 family)
MDAPNWEETFATATPAAFPRSVWYYESGDWVRGYNNELQAYVRAGSPLANALKTQYGYEAVSVHPEGGLLLRAIRTPQALVSRVGGAPWLSGMVNSQGARTVRYGYLEAEIQLPNVRGTLPAFWMLRAREETSDEVDIAEVAGDTATGLKTHYFSVHDYSSRRYKETVRSKQLADLGEGFHSFGLDWTETSLQAYLDRQPVGNPVPTPKGMKNDFYIILNLAVGGDWPRNPPATVTDIQMRVRRVTHWLARPF